MLARAAAAFVRGRAWQVFGFARLDDHARERFGRSGRWLRDLAALGEGLSRSAPLAAALTGSDGGRPLGRVAATLIARAACAAGAPADGAEVGGAVGFGPAFPAVDPAVEAWIDAARRLSVRDLRAALRLARAGSGWGLPPMCVPGESANLDAAAARAAAPGTGAPDAPTPGGPAPDAPAPDASVPVASAAAGLTEADDDPDSDRVLLRLPVPLPILAAFDEGLDLHRAVEGRSATLTEFVEALVGEAQASGLHEETAGLTAGLASTDSEAQVEAALRRATSAWAALPPPAAADCEDAALEIATTGPAPLDHAALASTAANPLASLHEFHDLAANAGRGDAAELDQQIRALVAIEDVLEARLGEVLAALSERRAWARLQFAGVGHYAEERLGMSRSRAGERARLARALRDLRVVAAACASGRIAMESAALIHRILAGRGGGGPGARSGCPGARAGVADTRAGAAGTPDGGPGTCAGGHDPALEAAWVAHASEVTIKRMRDEARAAGRYRARPYPAPASPAAPFRPLSDAAWRRSIRREVGTATRRIHAFGLAAAGLGTTPEPDVFLSRLPEPDVFLRLRLPAEIATGILAAFRAARDRVADRVASVPWDEQWPPAPTPSTPPSEWAARLFFVAARRVPPWVGLLALLEDFAATWDTDEAAPDRRDDRIFNRDGWRCAAPGCTSRCNLEDHHIIYRSRGGDDGEWNRITLCRFHHQRGEHGGLMQVRGTAPLDLTWRLGRDNVAVVYRNERREGGERLESLERGMGRELLERHERGMGREHGEANILTASA